MFLDILRLNLQFFSADPGGGGGTPPTDPATDPEPKDPPADPEPKDPPEKTFTQAELEEIVKQRVARAEIDKQKAIDEAKKLAKMNEDEKQQYEHEKTQRENEELKAKLSRYELGKEATKMLAESSIVADDEILEFVVRDDAEQTKQAVKSFSELVDRISDERMKEKLKGTPPKKGQGGAQAVTKESIMEIKDSAERIKAIQENPHLFK